MFFLLSSRVRQNFIANPCRVGHAHRSRRAKFLKRPKPQIDNHDNNGSDDERREKGLSRNKGASPATH